MKGETQFKEWLAPRLKIIPYSYFIKTQMLALVGVPDFLGCVRGRFVAIELKKDKETKPSKLQRYVLEQIRRAGGYGFVAYPENAKKILSKIERI